MTSAPRWKMLSCYVVAWSMIISTPLSCVSITYSVSHASFSHHVSSHVLTYRYFQAAQLLIATVQVGIPTYEPTSWHIYLVYLGMMFASYLVICLPTRFVSWFNIWAYFIGTIVLVVATILLPIKADHLNSAKDIFTKASLIFVGSTRPSLTVLSSLRIRYPGRRDGHSA
jgi:amino acid transporter